MIGAVVAGVDGSAGDVATVRAAAREAALRGRPLRLVHAYRWPPLGAMFVPELAGPVLGTLRERASTLLDDAIRMAWVAAPDVPVTAVALPGRPSAVLREQSRDASLLVLGSGPARRAAGRSACPVLVVRGEARAGAPVLAGSPRSEAALSYAAEAACRRHAELVVLQAWDGERTTPVTDEELALSATLADLSGAHPGLRLRWQVRHGPARRVLAYFSRNAQLVVVDDGAVGRHLIHESACPTVVVHR